MRYGNNARRLLEIPMAHRTQDQDATFSMTSFPTKGLIQTETQVALLTQDKETSLSMAPLTQIGGTRVALLTQGQGTTALMAHLTQAESPSSTGPKLTSSRGDLVGTEGHDEEQVEVCAKRQAMDKRDTPVSTQLLPSSTSWFAHCLTWQRSIPGKSVTHVERPAIVPLIWCATSDSSCDQLRQVLLEQNRGQEALMAFRVWWIEQGVHSASEAIPILNNIARQQGVRGPPMRCYQYLQAPVQEHIAILSRAERLAARDLIHPQRDNGRSQSESGLEARGDASDTSPAPPGIERNLDPAFRAEVSNPDD